MELVADFFSRLFTFVSFNETGKVSEPIKMSTGVRVNDRHLLGKDVLAGRKTLLLAMNIASLVNQESFNITEENLNCYDLPSGLITVDVAHAVFELYTRRGRLSTTSVHKLLKLGYKSFKSRPNITHVTVTAADTVTVVGDIHGTMSRCWC